ncbi:hypothetical protein FQN57_000870 [Myotisia sp. PD_48]|nr:hypothetical protein FQN57_000870 [Myotisia sp. PD_48]
MDDIQLSYVVAFLAIVGMLLLTTKPNKSKTYAEIPIVGADKFSSAELKARYVTEANTLLKEGYQKFGDIFQLFTSDGPRIFVSRKYANELKNYHRHEVNNMKAIFDRLMGKYTKLGYDNENLTDAIQINLNQNLAKFIPDVYDEIMRSFATVFPPCEDWTVVNIEAVLLRIVSQASARAFVGPILSRNIDWLELTEQYVADAFVGGRKLKAWRPLLRPIAQYFVPEIRRIPITLKRAHTLLLPLLTEKTEAAKMEGYQKPNDLIEWVRDRVVVKGGKPMSYREETLIQVLATTGSIHTTRMTIFHILLDLAARPEYIEPLREEVREVLRKSGPQWTKASLSQLQLMDSFMKESQRLNPPSLATFERKLLIPITLSNGMKLPAGQVVHCNTAVLEDAPANWGDPNIFDGFRFHRLRSNPSDSNKYQFASSNLEFMEWGLGREACPGRFYASCEIKIILAHILLKYEIAFENPEAGRPENFMIEVDVIADPRTKLQFKERKD